MARLLCAIALAGQYTPYGYAHAILHSVDAFLDEAGAERLAQVATVKPQELTSAAWVTLRAVPDRDVSEAVKVIKRVAQAVAMTKYDFAEIATRDDSGIREWVFYVTDEPTAALFVLDVIAPDKPHIRPLVSGGCAALLMRVGVTDWCDGLLGGMKRMRSRATRWLEGQPRDFFLACEDWGKRGCPEACPECCLLDTCDAILRGLI